MSGRRQSNQRHSHSSSHNNNRDNSMNNDKDRKFKNTEDQCSLLIENISDPETYKDFEREVKSFGLTTKFWINKRSKTCVVSYSNQEDAILAFSKFTRMTWPLYNGDKLRVKLLQNVEVSQAITRIQKSQNITRPEQEAFKDRDGRDDDEEDYERREKKRFSNERESRDKDYKDKRGGKDRERERSEKDKDRFREERDDDRFKKRSPNKYYEDRFDSNKDRSNNQKRINPNFLKTNYQPSVYYTIQSKEVVQQRKEMIESLFQKK